MHKAKDIGLKLPTHKITFLICSWGLSMHTSQMCLHIIFLQERLVLPFLISMNLMIKVLNLMLVRYSIIMNIFTTVVVSFKIKYIV